MPPEYRYEAVGSGPEHHGLLGDQALSHWEALESHVSSLWAASPEQHDLLLRVKGSVDKLSASLLQASRLKAHHDALVQHAKANASDKATLVGLSGLPALADFEGLLLHSRAALDGLTWLLSGRFRNQTQSFRSLMNVLADFRDSRPDAAALLSHLQLTRPWFDSLLASIDGQESLRDLVGHKHSLSEGVETCFSAAYLSTDRAIVLDCEVGLMPGREPIPLLASAHEMVKYLSFTILSCLQTLFALPTIELEHYTPTWTLLSTVRTQYLLSGDQERTEGSLSLVTVRRVTPAGFEAVQRRYRSEVLQRAVDLAAV